MKVVLLLRAEVPTPVFFYHPDHLGTSTVISNSAGAVHQYFFNLPFGETMIEGCTNTSYELNYKFNAKELDAESGLYYYGARYYDPRISVWMSVDPLAEKYSYLSPYQYCGNNPISNLEIDGADWIPTQTATKSKGYNEFITTSPARRMMNEYQTGSMKKHDHHINYNSKHTSWSGSADITISSIPIAEIQGKDISAESKMEIFVDVFASDDPIAQGNTYAHELFLHIEKKAKKIDAILKNNNLTPNEKAKRIRRVYEKSFIVIQVEKDGIFPGSAEHAEILDGSNKSYEEFSNEYGKRGPVYRKRIEDKKQDYYKNPWIKRYLELKKQSR